MSDELQKRLDETPVTLEFTVQEVNILLNILNMPVQAPTMTLSGFITVIQNQAGPQVEKAKTAFEAVAKAQDESQSTA